MDYRPTIAITMGDPAGIGAEVIVKALADPVLRQRARYVIYGMNELLHYAADLAELDVFWWRDQYQGRLRHYGFDDAVVTAPIAKESWKLAGYHFPGHTELFAQRTGARRYNMMFTGGPLRVVLATVHLPLMAIWNRLNIGAVFQPIELMNQTLIEWFDIPKPRIGVCGLNPHASENGQFGDEEERIISPAILMARDQGIDVSGPYPSDTVFIRAKQGGYDAVVAMYHDQGLIPVK